MTLGEAGVSGYGPNRFKRAVGRRGRSQRGDLDFGRTSRWEQPNRQVLQGRRVPAGGGGWCGIVER